MTDTKDKPILTDQEEKDKHSTEKNKNEQGSQIENS